MMDPFGCDIEIVNENLQEELIELKCCDKSNYIRLKLTNFKPNVEGLVAKHQPQGSH